MNLFSSWSAYVIHFKKSLGIKRLYQERLYWKPFSHRGNGIGEEGMVVEKLGQAQNCKADLFH